MLRPRQDHKAEPVCDTCDKPASMDRDSLAAMAMDPDYTSASEVARDDGTYNAKTNRYRCTTCYIKTGQPSSPAGWKVDSI